MMHRLWEQAITNDFVEMLIEEVRELYSCEDNENTSSKDRERYYASIGKYVCQELYSSFEKDFEI
mgnify:CR=1 FL=1